MRSGITTQLQEIPVRREVVGMLEPAECIVRGQRPSPEFPTFGNSPESAVLPGVPVTAALWAGTGNGRASGGVA